MLTGTELAVQIKLPTGRKGVAVAVHHNRHIVERLGWRIVNRTGPDGGYRLVPASFARVAA